MQLTLLKSKIHRGCVTGSNIDYEGSIFIDDDLLAQANILAYEKVEIYNITNGQRFATYAVPATKSPEVANGHTPTSGYMCINGAAARLVLPGDLIIIASYAIFTEQEAQDYQPQVLLMDGTRENRIDQLIPSSILSIIKSTQ